MADARSPPVSLAETDMNELFSLSPVPTIVLSSTYRIQKASRSLLEAWSMACDECEGHDLFILLQDRRLACGDDEVRLRKALDEAVATRGIEKAQATSAAPEKAVIWSIRVIPIFRGDELLSILLEWEQIPVSELPALPSRPPPSPAVTRSLSPSSSLLPESGLTTDEAFQLLVQAVKDYAIFLLDTKGNIVTWNTGAELHKGYKKHEIVGRHFSIFYGEEDLKARKPEIELEVCMREGRVEDEGWRYRKDGTRFWANVIITAIFKNGVHVGFGKVTRDLTERKAAELRLIAAYEESAKLKSDFLANMSHEIRTPMHGMLSACNLLLDTPLTQEQREAANIIGESGQVLLQVINDILDYSKLASGNFSINTDIVGVISIIMSVVRSVQTTLHPGVHFELLLAQDLPRSVQGDPLRYRQIVQNIIGNAAKFTEKGSITVTARLESQDDDYYVVYTEVTDTGIGISEAASRNLFKPFMQLDSTTKKRYQGTGLGLSICKSLVELMGGKLGFHPNPARQGSVFWFTAKFLKIKSLSQLQNLKSQNSPREAPRVSSRPSSQASSAGTATPSAGMGAADDEVRCGPIERLRELAPSKRVLVVEDNLINQKVLLGMLRALHFRDIAVASDGAQAVVMVRSNPTAYDLVLMDINMPIVDGHEATAQIRESGIQVPIVAMTAYALKGDMEVCLEKGMDDYIPKPMEKKLLVRVLLKWLGDGGGKEGYASGSRGNANESERG